MCISINPVTFTNTTVYSAEVKKDKEIYHVIGYQNSASYYDKKLPNAMLLPFPSKEKVTRANLVNASEFKNILKEYSKAVGRLKPQTRRSLYKSADPIIGAALNNFDVFESGSYIVVLVENASYLKEALKEVPENKRPDISDDFILSLNKLYLDWPIALCCFSGAMSNPEPLFWWYKPQDDSTLFAPAIDAHNGKPPNVDESVSRDHTLIFSSYESDKREDYHLRNYIEQNVPEEHRWLFNARICGSEVNTITKNGDFKYPLNMVKDSGTNAWISQKQIKQYI